MKSFPSLVAQSQFRSNNSRYLNCRQGQRWKTHNIKNLISQGCFERIAKRRFSNISGAEMKPIQKQVSTGNFLVAKS
jgi:hypothetical protein